MPEKPAILSTWATDGGTRLEPSAGEKAAGYLVDDQPPLMDVRPVTLNIPGCCNDRWLMVIRSVKLYDDVCEG